jgi:hypothetical protein
MKAYLGLLLVSTWMPPCCPSFALACLPQIFTLFIAEDNNHHNALWCLGGTLPWWLWSSDSLCWNSSMPGHILLFLFYALWGSLLHPCRSCNSIQVLIFVTLPFRCMSLHSLLVHHPTPLLGNHSHDMVNPVLGEHHWRGTFFLRTWPKLRCRTHCTLLWWKPWDWWWWPDGILPSPSEGDWWRREMVLKVHLHEIFLFSFFALIKHI